MRSNRRAAVLVCAKCQKRLGRGFGPDRDQRLSKLLRRMAGGKGRKAGFGVVEVGCLKVCPKGAVVTVRGDRPADWLLLRPDDAVEEIARRLGLTSDAIGVGQLPA